jgi:hypothetical protein
VQKIKGPFRLVHMDGREWDCPTLDRVVRIVRQGDWNHNCLSYIGDQPFERSYSAPPWNAQFEKVFNAHRWIVRDECGLIIPRWWLDRNLPKPTRRYLTGRVDRRTGDWSQYRGRTVDYTGSGGGYRSYFRYPRTMQEIREYARTAEELREYDIHITRRYVPTARDDIHRGNTRNWKRHRRTQWKDRG